MKKFLVIYTILIVFFTGCTYKKMEGKVVDSEIEGLEYQCAGATHFTKKDGKVTCYHFPIGFKVGEIKLGLIYDMPKDRIILPQDILWVKRDNVENKNVVKLIRLLQALDADKNPENGITITKEVREKLSKFIDLQKVSMQELRDKVTIQLGYDPFDEVDSKSAIEHLRRSMKRYKIIK